MIQKNALVLYKGKPALVRETGQKISISTADGKTKSVRPKDLQLLHPGPLDSLSRLKEIPLQSSLQEVTELMTGEKFSFVDACELVFSEYSPLSAWNMQLLLDQAIYFSGCAEDGVLARSRQEIEEIQNQAAEKEAQEKERQLFLERIKQNQLLPEDQPRLNEIEAVALGKSSSSRLMKDLGMASLPERAHALLLRLQVWDLRKNPFSQREGVDLETPLLDFSPPQAETEGLDLREMPAFAIDDEGSTDPDDALSFAEGYLWVHIADVAESVPPSSKADRLALERASNLYLPEGTSPMLPLKFTDTYGLGLHEESPALSFRIKINPDGELVDFSLHLTRLKVTRMSYAEADAKLDQGPLSDIKKAAFAFRDWRLKNGASNLKLPEVKLRLQEDGEIKITPLPDLESRDMVMNCMLAAGYAAALYGEQKGIPLPFTCQEPSEQKKEFADDLASRYQARGNFQRSFVSTQSRSHAGLGLPQYVRVTSPLRRYLDLLANQQLRNSLLGKDLLDHQQIMERTASYDAQAKAISITEKNSNLHWKLVYLSDNPESNFQGVLVEKKGQQSTFLIPELAMMTKIHLSRKMALNESIKLKIKHVDVTKQNAVFSIDEE